MSKKKDSEATKVVKSQKRRRLPRMPKDSLFLISRGNSENSVILRASPDITEEEFNMLLKVLKDFVESNSEPEMVHFGYAPPPS